jgi:hypothetical protein
MIRPGFAATVDCLKKVFNCSDVPLDLVVEGAQLCFTSFLFSEELDVVLEGEGEGAGAADPGVHVFRQHDMHGAQYVDDRFRRKFSQIQENLSRVRAGDAVPEENAIRLARALVMNRTTNVIDGVTEIEAVLNGAPSNRMRVLASGDALSDGQRDLCLYLGGLMCRAALDAMPQTHENIFCDAIIEHLRTGITRDFQIQGVVQGYIAGVHVENLHLFRPHHIPALIALRHGPNPVTIVEAAFVCYAMSGLPLRNAPSFMPRSPRLSHFAFHEEQVAMSAEQKQTFHRYVLNCFTMLLEAFQTPLESRNTGALQMFGYYKDVPTMMCEYILGDEVKNTTMTVITKDAMLAQYMVNALGTLAIAPFALRPSGVERVKWFGIAFSQWRMLLDGLSFADPFTNVLYSGQAAVIHVLELCVRKHPPLIEKVDTVIADLQEVADGHARWSALRVAWLGARHRAGLFAATHSRPQKHTRKKGPATR